MNNIQSDESDCNIIGVRRNFVYYNDQLVAIVTEPIEFGLGCQV